MSNILKMGEIEFAHSRGIAQELAAKIVEHTSRIIVDKIQLSDGSPKALRALENLAKDGFNIPVNSPLMQLSAPGNAGGGDSFVGQSTFELMNRLLQDISPANDISDSPFNMILPFVTNTAVEVQQDKYSSNYGWAGDSNGIDGIQNEVPLLSASGDVFTGYMYGDISRISGNVLVTLRELGVSDTKAQGLMQRIMMQQILLVQRVLNTVELNRIEAINKGSFTFKGVPVSTQIPASNIFYSSASLGTYTKSTNRFSPNAALTANLLKELSFALTYIINTGNKIKHVLMDNITFGALFNSQAVSDQTRFMAANSNNTVKKIRENIFHITTIPALQGVDIMVDDGAIKLTPDTTSTLNTRPIMWGKEVTSSSFRFIIVCEPTQLFRIGEMGFFPNVVARSGYAPQGGTVNSAGPSGAVTMITQDLAQFNALNQEIQMYASTVAAPMIYFPSGIFLFDPRVTVVD